MPVATKGTQLSWNSFLRSILAMSAALILGLLVDESFELWLGQDKVLLRILLQLSTIVLVVALLQRLGPRLNFNVVDNVFFLAIFLGVQQHLLQQFDRINLLPVPEVKKAQGPAARRT